MARLMYELEVERMIKQVQEKMETVFNGEVNSDYLYNHNNVCPRCKEQMKVMNNTVKT